MREAVGQGINLFSQKFRGSIIQENIVCQLAFSGQWQLLDQALVGLFRRNAALRQPPQLSRGVCGHADDEIKPILQPFFEQQGDLGDECLACRGRKNLPPPGEQPRVQEVLQPCQRDLVGEHDCRNMVSSDPPGRIKRSGAETLTYQPDYVRLSEDFFPDRPVGIQPLESALGEQGGGR